MRTWSLPGAIHKYLYKKDINNALGYLSKISALNQDNLFTAEDESYLRYVGAFRVQLLMEWGYYREALAWACLECELYPDNFNAIIYRESIKKKILNLPKNYNTPKPTESVSAWKGIAGMREVKAIVERDIIMPLNNGELYERFRVPLPNGYLFYGPPGCGKTYFVSKLAARIGYDFIHIRPSDSGSIFVHGTQLELQRIFNEARKRKPVLLFFDEFESVAPSRSSSDVSFHYKAEVNELLTQLDNIAKSGILFIAATNYIRNIDDAILRPGRIDKKIFIGPPDYEARVESFKIQLHKRPVSLIRFDILAEMSEYFTHADIEYICNEATRLCINKRERISTDSLAKIIHNYHPQLNEVKVQEYL